MNFFLRAIGQRQSDNRVYFAVNYFRITLFDRALAAVIIHLHALDDAIGQIIDIVYLLALAD